MLSASSYHTLVRVSDEGLIYLTRDPINAETPLARQAGIITPTRLHYVRDHFAVPDPPDRLVVEGAARTRLQLTLDDIRALRSRSLVVTLECAGNGRAYLDPPTPGEQWRSGAVGTAEWTGVPLRAVLDMADPSPSAVEVLFVGADEGTPKEVTRRIAFERSLPIADALESDALLAYAMNGEPLPLENGAPLRLIVPGWYGMASVKWLARIRLLERPFQGFYQTDRYVIDKRPLREIAPRALITSPTEGARLPVRAFIVRGYVWSGRGEPERVQVSADGGGTWQDAALSEPISRYAWREWRCSVDPRETGALTLLARVVTKDGETQPLAPVPTALGYANTGAIPVRVTIGA